LHNQNQVKVGEICASINYRLLTSQKAPGATYKDQAGDIASAVAFMIENASEFGAASSEVILYGHSSGAHMVGLLGTEKRYLERFGVGLADIKTIVSSDVHNDNVPWALQRMMGTRYEQNITKPKQYFGETVAEQRQASPVNFLSNSEIPPTLLLSAEFDKPGATYGGITDEAQEIFKDLLVKAGHSAWHIHFEDDTHSGMLLGFGEANDAQTLAVEAFLSEL
jgi:acetyl esterase/lipase